MSTDPVQLLIDAGAIPSAPFDAASRYNGVPLKLHQPRPEQPGIAHVGRRLIPAQSSIGVAARYVVNGSDRPDGVAARTLGDPLLLWRLADANAVLSPDELTDTLGRSLVIPLPPGM